MTEAKDAQDLQQEQQEIQNAQQERLNAAVPEDPRNKPNPVAGGFAGDSSSADAEAGEADDQTPVGADGLPADAGDDDVQKTVYPEGGGPGEDLNAEPDDEPEDDEPK